MSGVRGGKRVVFVEEVPEWQKRGLGVYTEEEVGKKNLWDQAPAEKVFKRNRLGGGGHLKSEAEDIARE